MENKNIVDFDIIKEKIKTTHTTTIKNICMDLKCSRGFVTNNVLPAISSDKIFLSRKWLMYLNEINNTNLIENTYYNTEKYVDFIKNSINLISRQTILIDNNLIYKNYAEFKKNKEKLLKSNKRLDVYYLKQEIFKLEDIYLNKLGKYVLAQKQPNKMKRTEIKSIDIKNIDFDLNIKNFKAIHDIKEYGDTDEMIYRYLFSTGHLKIEMKFLKENSKKVFYYDLYDGNYKDKTLISYETYLKCEKYFK